MITAGINHFRWQPTEVVPAEVGLRLLGMAGFCPYVTYLSSPRVHMLAMQLGQIPETDAGEERRIQTGIEKEYGKYPFGKRMPEDGTIIQVIPNAMSSINGDNVPSTMSLVVYEEEATKAIGCIELPEFICMHTHLGYPLVPNLEGMRQLAPQRRISKDTVFMNPPSISADGVMKYGRNANICRMTHPAVAEDGIRVRRGYVDSMGIWIYERRVISYGTNHTARNLYGDEMHYCPFPEVGQKIRPDGLLAALLPNDPPELAAVTHSMSELREVDLINDELTYAVGPGGTDRTASEGVVVSVQVDHDPNRPTDPILDAQPLRYWRIRHNYCKRVVELYQKLTNQAKRVGNELQLTPEFHRLVVECMAVINYHPTHQTDPVRLGYQYKKEPIDTFRVEIVVKYRVCPSIGFKASTVDGGKATIVEIGEDHEMPVDQFGTVADIVFDPNSPFARMIPSAWYEHYFNDVLTHTHRELCVMLGVKPFEKREKTIPILRSLPPEKIQMGIDWLVGMYTRISWDLSEKLHADGFDEHPIDHLAHVIEQDCKIGHRPDHPIPYGKVMSALKNSPYNPPVGPVTYVGNSGKRRVTKKPIRIAKMYVILLEKIANNWSAVSMGRLHHFGVLAPMNRDDKYATSGRWQPVKAYGESEIRVLLYYVGAQYVANVMNNNNDPKTMELIADAIIASATPGRFGCIVDRNQVPFAGSRPIRHVQHIMQCAGFSCKWADYIPHWKKYPHLYDFKPTLQIEIPVDPKGDN